MQRLISRLLPVIAASVMTLAATAGHAATSSLFQTQDVLLTSGTEGSSYTGAAAATHTEAGSFLDTFKLTATGNSLVEVVLITIGAGDDQTISFTSAWLNGTALNITTTDNADGSHTSFAYLSQDGLVGDLVLTVQGYAGGSLASGSGIAASYSGNFNVVPTAASAVPEPQTGALILAGLGAVGFILSRRRRV